jgi:hypothetical protein
MSHSIPRQYRPRSAIIHGCKPALDRIDEYLERANPDLEQSKIDKTCLLLFRPEPAGFIIGMPILGPVEGEDEIPANPTSRTPAAPFPQSSAERSETDCRRQPEGRGRRASSTLDHQSSFPTPPADRPAKANPSQPRTIPDNPRHIPDSRLLCCPGSAHIVRHCPAISKILEPPRNSYDQIPAFPASHPRSSLPVPRLRDYA